jgi:hypothetical protein
MFNARQTWVSMMGTAVAPYHFKTNKSGLTSITLTVSSGTVTIDWGEGSPVSGLGTGTHSKTYVDSSNKNIYITGSIGNITSLTFTSSQVYECDLAPFTGLTTLVLNSNTFTSLNISSNTLLTTFNARTCTSMTTLTTATSTALIADFKVDGCTALTGLNVSGYSNLRGIFHCFGNTAMTSLTTPTSSAAFTQFYFYGCTSLTSANLIGLTGLGGNVYGYSCTVLNSLTLPTSTQTITGLWFYSNPALTSINISGFSVFSAAGIYLYQSGYTTITNPSSASGTVNAYWCYSTSITSLNLGGFGSTLGGDIRYYSCSSLTSVTNPTSSRTITTYWGYSCNITGTFSISGLSGLGDNSNANGAYFQMYSNPLMTGITNPTSSARIGRYWVENCGLTSLNLSTLTGLGSPNGGGVTCQSNPIATLTMPASSNSMSYFYGYSLSASLTTMSFAGLTFGANFDLRVYSNSGMTGLTLPSGVDYTFLYAYSCAISNVNNLNLDTAGSVGAQCIIRLDGNGMSQALVDEILTDIYTSAANFNTSLSLNVSGSNAAPSGTYTASCPPTNGKQYQYELVNNSCALGFTTWTITANT